MRSPKVVSIVGLVAAFSTPSFEALAQTSMQIREITKPQIEAIQLEKASRTLAQQKMSSHLLDALKKNETGKVSANAPNLAPQPLTETKEGVLVDITATVSEDLVGEIERLGGRVVNKHAEFDAIRASMPLETIEQFAGRADVRQVIPAVKARKNAAFAAEGDIAHTADLVRAKFGTRGAGIRIGVLSDSIDDGFGALENAFKSGAMDPKLLTVLEGQDGDGEGEGLAMAEIIHALAPEAHVFFASGYDGPAQMAANIKALAAQGCQIIVDDLTYFNESPFQDGPISRAVNSVSEIGVLYFSSARNSGNKKQGTSGTWEGDFRDGGPAGKDFSAAGSNARIHVFEDTGTKRVTLNTVEKATQNDRVDLFWADPLGGSKNNYDLFVVNSAGQVVRSSTSSHSGSQDPYQSVERLKKGESIVIVKEDGSEGRFLHLDTGRAVLRYGTDGSVRGHNASGAANAFSVAAKRVPTPAAPFRENPSDSVESFSSDGPRRIFFGPNGTPLSPGNFSSTGGLVLSKPDITAANGISTTLPSGSLNPFFGTSAAAPHAAAIAALLLSCSPKPDLAQIRTALRSSTLAIDGKIPNTSAGNGIVMAIGAANSVCQMPQQTAAAVETAEKPSN